MLLHFRGARQAFVAACPGPPSVSGVPAFALLRIQSRIWRMSVSTCPDAMSSWACRITGSGERLVASRPWSRSWGRRRPGSAAPDAPGACGAVPTCPGFLVETLPDGWGVLPVGAGCRDLSVIACSFRSRSVRETALGPCSSHVRRGCVGPHLKRESETCLCRLAGAAGTPIALPCTCEQCPQRSGAMSVRSGAAFLRHMAMTAHVCRPPWRSG